VNNWKSYTASPRIAYFSMEIGLSYDIPTYSGGLGVLAGDTIKSAADLKLPMVAVTLLSRKGYFRQAIDDGGWQHESEIDWLPEKFMELLPQKTLVTIEDRDVKVQPWLYRVKSPTGGVVPILFLDTDIPGNADQDRHITDHLYGGGLDYRLKQEAILGIGGARILSALGFKVMKYHLNEGHASLLTFELMSHESSLYEDAIQPSNPALRQISEKCVFTTHTPVEAGHDKFPWEMVERILRPTLPLELLKLLGGKDHLNMTMLALNLSHYVNGVAKKHGQISQEMFPGFVIHAITNGVHPFTWASPFFTSLYDRYLPGWANEPELLVRVDNIPDEEIWEAHSGAKALLAQYVKESSGVQLDPEILTIGFARRSATYKRADLIFHDLDRLLALGEGKLQLVFGGKAHPQDEPGKRLIQNIVQNSSRLRGRLNAVYLQNYNMEIAATLIPGVDIWLNNPMRPLEASGTSGMKAALNGVPNFSILDGWWIEGHIEGVTGWSIGPEPGDQDLAASAEEMATRDAEDLYSKLESVIMPIYYRNRTGWTKIMKSAIGKNAYYFNTHAMLRRYVTEAYIR